MAENNFNKVKGNTTLIGNWQEERVMQNHTGYGRTKGREHIPKKHGDLENPINHDKVFDDTKKRIYGKTEDQKMKTEAYYYGKAVNPASMLATTGKRTIDLERQIREEVLNEQK